MFQTVVISNLNISQGSVATHLMCGCLFANDFIANLQVNLLEQEF